MNYKKPIIVATLGVLISTGVLMSCGKQSDKTEAVKTERVKELDSLVRARLSVGSTEALAFVDSIENMEEVSPALVCYFRATIYNGMAQKATSELYFQKSLEGDELLNVDKDIYYKASDYYSAFLANRGEYADALTVATKAYEVSLKDLTPSGKRWTAVLLHAMGYFQVQLGLKEEAEKNFSMAYMTLSQTISTDSSYENLLTYARVSYNILDAYTSTDQYDKALEWVSLAEKAAEQLTEHPEAKETDKTNYVGGVAIHKALVMLKMGIGPSAELSYKQSEEVGYFDTTYGLLEQAHFLKEAERWDMLADLMPRVDSVAKAWNVPNSLHYVKTYVAPQFHAYLQSGKTDKALEVAEKMAVLADSVAAYETDHKMKEIAVIAAQKDQHTAAAKQCAMQAWLWVKILSITLVVLVLCILGYVTYRIIKAKK